MVMPGLRFCLFSAVLYPLLDCGWKLAGGAELSKAGLFPLADP